MTKTPTRQHQSVVAYLRVSTSEQAKSGLGLEAQQETFGDSQSLKGSVWRSGSPK